MAKKKKYYVLVGDFLVDQLTGEATLADHEGPHTERLYILGGSPKGLTTSRSQLDAPRFPGAAVRATLKQAKAEGTNLKGSVRFVGLTTKADKLRKKATEAGTDVGAGIWMASPEDASGATQVPIHPLAVLSVLDAAGV